MDIIRTHCLHDSKTPPVNTTGHEVTAVRDAGGKIVAHLVLLPGRDGYMITDESNYRPWFQKCVCSLECGQALIRAYTRGPVTLSVLAPGKGR